jgi:hypothetical protein
MNARHGDCFPLPRTAIDVVTVVTPDGGLDMLTRLLAPLPAALVIVQHICPTRF